MPQRCRLFIGSGRILTETEPLKTADELACNRHFALVIHLGHEGLLLLQPPQQHGRAPVNKSLRQSAMQRIRQSVFYSARLGAPMAFVISPALALRNIGPGADIGQPFRDGINVAARFIYPREGLFQPIRRDSGLRKAAPGQEIENSREQSEMLIPRCVAEIGDAANLPQQFYPLRRVQLFFHLGQFRQVFQRQHVIGIAGAGQPFVLRRGLKAANQPLNAAKL